MPLSAAQNYLRLAERALREAEETERWALKALSNDPNGHVHHAWTAAQRTVRELKQLIEHLAQAST